MPVAQGLERRQAKLAKAVTLGLRPVLVPIGQKVGAQEVDGLQAIAAMRSVENALGDFFGDAQVELDFGVELKSTVSRRQQAG